MSSCLSLLGYRQVSRGELGVEHGAQQSFSTPVDQICKWVEFAPRSSPQRQVRYDWDCYGVQVSYISLLSWLNLHCARRFILFPVSDT